MNKKQILLAIALFAASAAQGQLIDFDFPGKENPDKHTEKGYTSWAVPRTVSAEKTFANGVTITLTAGGAASAVASNWSKYDVETTGLKLIGEEVLATNLDDDNNMTPITEGSTSLIFTVTGLSAGEHTLKAYHNNSDKNRTQPDISVAVDGNTC